MRLASVMVDELVELVLTRRLGSELPPNLADSREARFGDVVKGDHPGVRPDVLDVLPHRCLGMVAVDEYEVERPPIREPAAEVFSLRVDGNEFRVGSVPVTKDQWCGAEVHCD